MADEGPNGIQHLTRIPRSIRWASKIDKNPWLRPVLGSIGVIWLPALAAVFASLLLPVGYIEASTAAWAVGALAVVQAVSGLVAHGAKQEQVLSAAAVRVMALREFLDHIHSQVFSRQADTRISIMVPVSYRGGTVLKVFLRPSIFPSKSNSQLAVDCNTGEGEGAAGAAYCQSTTQRIEVRADPDQGTEALADYARQSLLPLRKVRLLVRKARFYLAFPIGDSVGPHFGVFVVDHAKLPQITSGDVEACKRAEDLTVLLSLWVALQLRAIPDEIKERA